MISLNPEINVGSLQSMKYFIKKKKKKLIKQMKVERFENKRSPHLENCSQCVFETSTKVLVYTPNRTCTNETPRKQQWRTRKRNN